MNISYLIDKLEDLRDRHGEFAMVRVRESRSEPGTLLIVPEAYATYTTRS